MSEVLPINPSANVFVFVDVNVHQKDYPILVELIDLVNSDIFSISNDLTQMVNFPTCIPHCDSHSPALLDLSFSSNASICSTMAFSSLVNFDHAVISVSIDFLSNLKKDAPLQSITYDYSCVDWDGLHDHLRDVP